MTAELYFVVVAGVPAVLGFVLRRVAVVVLTWVAVWVAAAVISTVVSGRIDITLLGAVYIASVYVALPAAVGASTGVLARRLVTRHRGDGAPSVAR
jgi:hypothetical protein